jgi:hypothetical protein
MFQDLSWNDFPSFSKEGLGNHSKSFPRSLQDRSWNGIPRFSKTYLGMFQDFGMLEKHFSKNDVLGIEVRGFILLQILQQLLSNFPID